MARYAISDIHGCLRTFQVMVEEVLQIQPHDHLYLLGDYINKGPDSKGVLDYILTLQKKGHQITCLRGNHDQLLLDAVDEGESSVWLKSDEKEKTLESFGVEKLKYVPERYISFIRSMPLLLILDDFILVHAGIDLSLKNPLATSNYTLMNTKRMKASTKKLGGKILVHGHLPQPKSKIEKAIKKRTKGINLDAGCVYYKNEEFGYLCALNLDSFETYWQKNIDLPYEVKVK
ncbi:metallophosphoesterase family protein [Rufibacter roseus]|uniref:Metallophosphoesterase family protein n=1 Tax=Rufibacter roseus TaxID=1567108 RepID=A0ABW2DF77_9BACT|nr:metallophosphoesterase family protein [Rufibacter roseus]